MLQTIHHSARSTTCAQDEGLAVFGLQKRSQRFGEPYPITIGSHQALTALGRLHAHHIDRTNGGSLWREAVKARDDGLLVRNRHVEAAQTGMARQYFGIKLLNPWQLKVEIFGRNPFARKLFGEEGARETMA